VKLIKICNGRCLYYLLDQLNLRCPTDRVTDRRVTMDKILLLLTDLKAVSLKDLSDLPDENQYNVALRLEQLQEELNQALEYRAKSLQ